MPALTAAALGFSLKHLLYVAGGMVEFFGIVTLAAPDAIPVAARVGRWLLMRLRKLLSRLGVRRRTTPANLGPMSASGSSSASAILSTGAQTLEDKVAYLLRRDRETQDHINRLFQQLEELRVRSSADLQKALAEIHRELDRRIAAVQTDYRAGRIVGAVLLAVGLALSTWGNFLK